MRVRERSRAKSSAAKIRPFKRGVEVVMVGRLERERADSIRARILRGGFCVAVSGLVVEADLGVVEEVEGCRSGSVCRRTSIMKWRSEALFTLGITRASMLGAFS